MTKIDDSDINSNKSKKNLKDYEYKLEKILSGRKKKGSDIVNDHKSAKKIDDIAICANSENEQTKSKKSISKKTIIMGIFCLIAILIVANFTLFDKSEPITNSDQSIINKILNIFNNNETEISTETVIDASALDEYRETAITQINSLPYLETYMRADYSSKIRNCDVESEINVIVSDATSRNSFINEKQTKISQIQSLCGNYYYKLYDAQLMVSNIESISYENKYELNNYNSYDLEIPLKNMIYNSFELILSNSEYVYVIEPTDEYFTTSNKMRIDLKSKSIYELTQIIIKPTSSLERINLKVTADKCGELPQKGSVVKIYDLNDTSSEVCYGIVYRAYLLVDDISYSESKSVSISRGDSSEQTTQTNTYTLNSLGDVLQAAAAGKLSTSEIETKLDNYGLILNNLESETQIFDMDKEYFLIINVPDEKVPLLLDLTAEDTYIVVTDMEG